MSPSTSLHGLARAALLFFLLLPMASGQEPVATPNESAPATGERWAVIICGLPGDAEHRQRYAETMESLYASLTERLGFSADRVRIQFGSEPTAEDGPAVAGARGRATRADLQKEMDDLRTHLQPDDTLWVIVMGHAHFDGRRSYLNLPGADRMQSDLHQDEFARLFENVPARQQIFFITTSVSGFFIRPLSAKGRVIITATEADREVNETLFPHALAEVLAAPPGREEFDADQDGQMTLFDLYIQVARNVARRYLAEMLLATEHAQLDDNGDGRGTELQLDYLTDEEGGRATADSEPPRIRPNSDGFAARSVMLPLVFPTATTDAEPASPTVEPASP